MWICKRCGAKNSNNTERCKSCGGTREGGAIKPVISINLPTAILFTVILVAVTGAGWMLGRGRAVASPVPEKTAEAVETEMAEAEQPAEQESTGADSAEAAGTYRLIEERDPFRTTYYFYDADGKLEISKTYYKDELEYTSEYYYSPSGELVERTEYFPSTTVKLFFHFDRNGTMIERDDTGGLGSQALSTFDLPYQEEYRSDGLVEQFSFQYEDGDWSHLQYRYDEQGRILSLSRGERVLCEFTYAEDGSYRRTADYSSMGIRFNDFDASGHLIKQGWIRDGEEDVGQFFRYDERGQLIEASDDEGPFWTFTYEYDERGNLIAKTETDRSGRETRTEYIYEYVPG